MWCRIQQFLSWRLLLGVLVLLFLIGLGSFTAQPVAASLRQMEEAPGQVLYQSRHTLRDSTGKSWQVVLYKRVKAGSLDSINLRLVGFPGVDQFTHPQPLQITTGDGEVLTAADSFAAQSPAPNVGEYNLKEVLPELPTNLPVRLLLPLLSNQSREIRVPPPVVLEWQDITRHEW
jgi:hypothetical protein